jgi:TolB protein
VAFVSNRVGAPQIYVIDVDGGNLRRLSVDDDRNHNNPLWSADGSLLFFSQGNPGNQSLYSVRVDGSDLQLLNQEQAQQVTMLLDVTQVASRTRIHSPNGTSTMFIAFRNRSWGIYSGADATSAQLLASLGETYSELPVWSADGMWVAFIVNHDGQRDVYVMHGDGSNLRRMTYTRAFDGQVNWRP